MIPPDHITDSMIDRAEDICGMGHNAWDCIPQQQVFAACVTAWLEAQSIASGDPDYSRTTQSAAAPPETPIPYTKPSRYAVIYTSDNGNTVVRYRRDRHDTRLAREVLTLQRRARKSGWTSPYSISTELKHIS